MTLGDASDHEDPVEVLLRWEASGAIWCVVRRSAREYEIELRTCSGDEVVGMLRSAQPHLISFVGERTRSDD